MKENHECLGILVHIHPGAPPVGGAPHLVTADSCCRRKTGRIKQIHSGNPADHVDVVSQHYRTVVTARPVHDTLSVIVSVVNRIRIFTEKQQFCSLPGAVNKVGDTI